MAEQRDDYIPQWGDRVSVVRYNHENEQTYTWPGVFRMAKTLGGLRGIVVRLDGRSDDNWFAIGDVGVFSTAVERLGKS